MDSTPKRVRIADFQQSQQNLQHSNSLARSRNALTPKKIQQQQQPMQALTMQIPSVAISRAEVYIKRGQYNKAYSVIQKYLFPKHLQLLEELKLCNLVCYIASKQIEKSLFFKVKKINQHAKKWLNIGHQYLNHFHSQLVKFIVLGENKQLSRNFSILSVLPKAMSHLSSKNSKHSKNNDVNVNKYPKFNQNGELITTAGDSVNDLVMNCEKSKVREKQFTFCENPEEKQQQGEEEEGGSVSSSEDDEDDRFNQSIYSEEEHNKNEEMNAMFQKSYYSKVFSNYEQIKKFEYYRDQFVVAYVKLLLTHYEYLKMQKEGIHAANVLNRAYRITSFVVNSKNEKILKVCGKVLQICGSSLLESGKYQEALKDYYKSLDYYQTAIHGHLTRFSFLENKDITVDMEVKLEQVVRELIILLMNMGRCYEQLGDFSKQNECFLLADYFSNRLLLYDDSEVVRKGVENAINQAHEDHHEHLREVWEVQRIMLMAWPDLLKKCQELQEKKSKEKEEEYNQYNETQKYLYDKFGYDQVNKSACYVLKDKKQLQQLQNQAQQQINFQIMERSHQNMVQSFKHVIKIHNNLGNSNMNDSKLSNKMIDSNNFIGVPQHQSQKMLESNNQKQDNKFLNTENLGVEREKVSSLHFQSNNNVQQQQQQFQQQEKLSSTKNSMKSFNSFNNLNSTLANTSGQKSSTRRLSGEGKRISQIINNSQISLSNFNLNEESLSNNNQVQQQQKKNNNAQQSSRQSLDKKSFLFKKYNAKQINVRENKKLQISAQWESPQTEYQLQKYNNNIMKSQTNLHQPYQSKKLSMSQSHRNLPMFRSHAQSNSVKKSSQHMTEFDIIQDILQQEKKDRVPDVNCLTTNKYFRKYQSLESRNDGNTKLAEQKGAKYKHLILRQDKEVQEKQQGVMNLDFQIKQLVEKSINQDYNLENYNDRFKDYVYQMHEEDFDKKEFLFGKKQVLFRKKKKEYVYDHQKQGCRIKSEIEQKVKLDNKLEFYKNIVNNEIRESEQNFQDVINNASGGKKIKKEFYNTYGYNQNSRGSVSKNKLDFSGDHHHHSYEHNNNSYSKNNTNGQKQKNKMNRYGQGRYYRKKEESKIANFSMDNQQQQEKKVDINQIRGQKKSLKNLASVLHTEQHQIEQFQREKAMKNKKWEEKIRHREVRTSHYQQQSQWQEQEEDDITPNSKQSMISRAAHMYIRKMLNQNQKDYINLEYDMQKCGNILGKKLDLKINNNNNVKKEQETNTNLMLQQTTENDQNEEDKGLCLRNKLGSLAESLQGIAQRRNKVKIDKNKYNISNIIRTDRFLQDMEKIKGQSSTQRSEVSVRQSFLEQQQQVRKQQKESSRMYYNQQQNNNSSQSPDKIQMQLQKLKFQTYNNVGNNPESNVHTPMNLDNNNQQSMSFGMQTPGLNDSHSSSQQKQLKINLTQDKTSYFAQQKFNSCQNLNQQQLQQQQNLRSPEKKHSEVLDRLNQGPKGRGFISMSRQSMSPVNKSSQQESQQNSQQKSQFANISDSQINTDRY